MDIAMALKLREKIESLITDLLCEYEVEIKKPVSQEENKKSDESIDTTVKEAFILRTKLEKLIKNLLNEYENKTNCKVKCLEIERHENYSNLCECSISKVSADEKTNMLG